MHSGFMTLDEMNLRIKGIFLKKESFLETISKVKRRNVEMKHHGNHGISSDNFPTLKIN